MTESLSQATIDAFAPDAKIALVATVDPDGLPRLSLLTTLAAKDSRTLMFGQFTEGESKTNLRRDHRAGYCVMTLDRRLWRGIARWTGEAREGEDYEAYNRRPMFRYNAYFGIHTIHYLELIEAGAQIDIPWVGIAAGTLAALAAPLGRGTNLERPLTAWGRGLLRSPASLKFVAHVDDQGSPRITPLVPASVSADDQLVLVGTGLARELTRLGEGTPLAVMALTTKMESLLVRGKLGGFRRRLGLPVARLELDWVYNSMPPTPGVVYPRQPLRALRGDDFVRSDG